MISVCMASYNGERYIYHQITTILKQLGPNDELVISDDGSKDNTAQIVKNIHDKRIKFIQNEGIHGFTHNFENALSHAKGDYIFLSDQDDIWLDDKIQVMMSFLKKYSFVISDCKTVDDNMNVIQESRFKAFDIKLGFLRHIVKSRFLGCCMAMRREVIEASLPFPKDDSLVEHDIWLAAVAMLYFDVALINQPLILYRRHNSNASDGGFDKGYSLYNKVCRRLYRLWELFKIKRRVTMVKDK